jgi:hypothetical protein
MLAVLAVPVAVLALARNHGLADSATLAALMVVSGLVARLLLRDLRKHPANFPKPAPSHGHGLRKTPERGRGFSPMANDPH